MSKGPTLDDIMPLLGDDEVLRIAREHGIKVSLSMDVLDKLDLQPVRPELVEAARNAVRSSVLVTLLTPKSIDRWQSRSA